jgi:hypothetical protein
MGTPSPELCNLWHARAFLKDIGLHRSEISW